MADNMIASSRCGYVVVINSSLNGNGVIEVGSTEEYPPAQTPNFWTSRGLNSGVQIVREFKTEAQALAFVQYLGDDPRLELLTRWAEQRGEP